MDIIQDLAADLEALLRAGRVDFPDKARMTAEAAGLLGTETRGLNRESAHAGDPQILRDALRACGDVHQGLRLLVQSLNYCSQGLIDMVADYAQTDVEAAQALTLVGAELTQGPPPAEAPVPPDFGHPERPGYDTYPDPVSSTPQPRDPAVVLDEHDDELESRPEVEFPDVPS